MSTFLSHLMDLQILIWIPLAYVTFRDAKKNWRTIWDSELTLQDRRIIRMINITFIQPILVLIHEGGHAIATLFCGGKIGEFHFAIWYGFVRPIGTFTAGQDLIIDLAGTAVQLIPTFALLIAAYYVTSPAVVATLVYAGLFSLSVAVITYPLLGVSGMYSDWTHIYSSPLTGWLFVVAFFHAALVVLCLYLMFGTKPRIWYSGKTRPKWYKDFLKAKEVVAKDPSAINYLSLAWEYYLVDLNKLCWKTLDIVEKKDPDQVERYFLIANLKNSKNDSEGAIEALEKVIDSNVAQPITKARALLSIGHTLGFKVEDRDVRKGQKPTLDDYTQTVTVYEQATKMEPNFADGEFYKATILNKVGLHNDAEKVLKDLQGKKWLDPALPELYHQELKVARKSDNPKQ